MKKKAVKDEKRCVEREKVVVKLVCSLLLRESRDEIKQLYGTVSLTGREEEDEREETAQKQNHIFKRKSREESLE